MVPLGLLAIGIAVLPVLLGSVHVDRVERAAAAGRARTADRGDGAVEVRPHLTVGCPTCLADLHGSSADELVDAVHRHAWQIHGIPSASHILESASRVMTSTDDGGWIPAGMGATD